MDFLGYLVAIQLLALAIYPMVESTPITITSDKETLISFKSQIFFELPNPLSTWDQNQSPCNWSGVTCNKHGERVIGLDLSGLRLTGVISPHIGNLTSLMSLELQNNQLTGRLPDQLSNLVSLRTLNLSFNSLQGEIPSNISQCKGLKVLDLMLNQVTGKIPEDLSHLTQLQVLNLAKNQLSGPLPSYLANISSLVHLNLNTNKFGGSIPSDFQSLVNLDFLDLMINNLSGTVPPSIYNMSSLVHLALCSNDFWGELPGDIGLTMPKLLLFRCCFNKFTGTIPWSLHNLTNIKTIYLTGNLLHGTVPPGLGNLPNLENYSIKLNNIVSFGQQGLSFLDSLTNSTRLNFLAINSNHLEGVIPKTIGNLSKVLTKLFMGENNIYGSIPSSIGNLRALQLLNLSHNSISGEIPPEMGQLKELRVLELAENRLSGKIPSSLGNLQRLTKFDLSKNEFVGSIPSTFGNFQNLIFMDLSNNKLSGSIPTGILSPPSPSSYLNLSQNYLTGPLPEEIGLLENTRIINISDNKLSGNIPSSFGNCKSLEQLLLARNMLSGQIPDTLVALKGLEILDLSANQLSGVIPSDLQMLHSLQLLNLSYNKLEGEVPTGGIFTDPSKVRLESNQNLCVGFLCKNPHNRERRLTIVYIIISVASTMSLCFAIGFLWYTRKGKGKIKDSVESIKGQYQMISYDELRLSTENFTEENLIEHGSFGFVCKGLLNGATIAVKVLDTTMARSRELFLGECAALRTVRHRNLIKLITICSSIDYKNEEFLALIFEFMSNGSLHDWLTGNRRYANGMGLNIFDRLSCAVGIASAIDYLHNETEVPIVHCDLKPANVLLDSDMTPKVADFGLAKLLFNGNDNQSSLSSTHMLKGSIGYIPPEYGFGEKPSTAGDVYSYGILLLELFTGKSPTHEIFTAGLSLKSWVQKEFPNNLEQVLELELLEQMNDFCEENQWIELESLRDCLITIFGVGLSCTADSPKARISIRDALCKLRNAEDILHKPEFIENRVLIFKN